MTFRLTRREALRLAAAAGLGLTGCPGQGPPGAARRPGGRIWGQDVALGHRLRTGELAGRAPDERREADVLIVGAGAAGLACAWRLARDGVAGAVVLEAAEAPGGNARAGSNEVSRFPWGAHYLRAPTAEHRALEVFLEDVGLIRGRDSRGRLDWDTRAVCADPTERVFERGLWAEGLLPLPVSHTAEDDAQAARFHALIDALGARRGADGRRAFAIPVDLSSRDPELLALDQETFAAWFERHGFTSPALRWYLDYACRDDYGCTIETASAWAGLHYFAGRLGGDPSRDVTLTWPEGNGRLIDLLLGAARPAVHTGALCVGLEPGAAPGDASAALVWHVAEDRLVRWEARHLVFAGPRFVLARLLPAPPPGSSAFTYAPWLVANVTLDVAPAGVGAPLAWDNVLHGSPSLGYVVANRDVRIGAPCVVTWYRALADPDPARARAALLALEHDDVVDMVLGELLDVHPTLAGRVRSVDAWRWGHAMIRPVPGFLWGPERQAALAPIGALLCASSDLSGISIFEEAFHRGVLAGEEILRRAGREFTSLLSG